MQLQELLMALPEAEVDGRRDREISHLAYDSRKVREKGLFVAIRGHNLNGHRYVDQAVNNGARVVVVEEDRPVPAGVTRIRVTNSREALSGLSACFYGYPASKMKMVGITGTGGKTTTSYLIESVLAAAGIRVGVLGSVSYRYGAKVYPAPVTTPESLDLQELLAEMVQEKVTHVVMEVSSHALDQGRVGHMAFDQAVFTNLSQDHLDYHQDMEAYFQAKAVLFRRYLKGQGEGLAIVNSDDPYGQRLWQEWSGPKKDYGLTNEAAYHPVEEHSDLKGIGARIRTPKGVFRLQSPLIGRFNLYNILAAWAVGEQFDLKEKDILKGMESLGRVPGRMEPIPNVKDLSILVDYSHKPEALRFALSALGEYGSGKILTVFGCGGERDQKKRPIMGRISGELSHLTVITSDNPRSEDPMGIIRAIEQGLEELGTKYVPPGQLGELPELPCYTIIPDRREAINLAIGLARPGDMVLIAGKGHETYQILGAATIAFDDREEARKALEKVDVQHR